MNAALLPYRKFATDQALGSAVPRDPSLLSFKALLEIAH
jgi:hypothetical protein